MTVTVALLMWYCCAVIDAVYAAVMHISCMHDNSYVCS